MPDNSALKHDEHEQREYRVIPVFIQAPEADAEDLKNEERRGRVLSEKGTEGWNWDVEFVLPEQLLEIRKF